MNLCKSFIKVFLLVAVLLLQQSLFAQVHTSSTYKYLLTMDETLRHLEYLTSEEVAGRAAGTVQARTVAEYIAGKFEEYGVSTFKSVSYFQPFTIVGKKELKGYNVVGYLPSKKKNADYIIVGAHFDHIGAIGDKFYPGADDNSSGVAAMLELARAFGKRFVERGDLDKNIVFVAFDGNNYNLQGSKFFVQRMGIPSYKVTCMLNLDQIGSTLAPVDGKRDYLLVLGADKLKSWEREQIDFANEFFCTGLHIDYTYYGSKEFYDIFYKLSDQKSFTDVGIPALLFTSGITKHTNKVTDNIGNLSVDVLMKRIELIYRFVWLLE